MRPTADRAHPSPVALTLAMCLAEIATMQGVGTFPALMPGFIDEWGLSNTDAGWIGGIYFAGYVLAVVVLVSLTDRVDARRVYLAGASVAAVALVGFAVLAEGFWSAVAFRTLAGIGLAGTYMPGMKMLSDRIDGAAISRATSFYTSSFGVGMAISYLAAGLIDEAWGWRWAFAAAALAAAGAVAIAGWAVAPLPRRERAAPRGHLLDFRPVLRNRRTMAFVAAYAAHNYELFAVRAWLVAFLTFAAGLGGGTALGATALVALLTLTGLPASVLGNELCLRFGRVRVIAAVMTASAAAAAGIGFTAALPAAVVVALLFAYHALVIGESSSITTGVVLNAPPEERGATLAVYSSLGFAGSFLGPLGFGVVLDLAGGREAVAGWGLAFAASGAVLLPGALAIARFGRGGGGDRAP